MGDHKAEKWVFDSCHKRSPFWTLQMAFSLRKFVVLVEAIVTS